MDKICLIACDSFIDELKTVSKEFDYVDAISYQGKCSHTAVEEKINSDSLDGYQNIIVIGGCMLNEKVIPQNSEIYKLESCFHMFAPKVLVQSYISAGGHIITPGWLKNWKNYITEIWAFDKKTAISFYKDFCKKLILLDTGIDENSSKNLAEFASFVEQPFEIVSIGLDYFRLYIENIVIKSRYKNSIKESKNKESEKLKYALQNSANYAMAFDLISKLNQKFDEKEIIDNILEMFNILYAPQGQFYISIDNKEIHNYHLSPSISEETIKKAMDTKETYLVEDNGFILKLKYNEDIVGILGISDISFPQYINQYINLAISISVVCSLAIVNARNYKNKEEMEAQLAQHAKLVAMGEMMGSIAHQWRQPLNELNINIEMLEEFYECGVIDDIFVEKFISKNTKILNFLSKTITDFSDFFRVNKQKVHFSIKQKIENTIEIVSAQLKNNNISIEIIGSDVEVYGLPNEFQQVVLNLINNSKDAIIEKIVENGKISISLEKIDSKAVLKFTDNAGGIPENILDRIFEPYFTTKEQGKGIGMGLYIVKMIIEHNFNSEINVKNIEDGVVFTIEIEVQSE